MGARGDEGETEEKASAGSCIPGGDTGQGGTAVLRGWRPVFRQRDRGERGRMGEAGRGGEGRGNGDVGERESARYSRATQPSCGFRCIFLSTSVTSTLTTQPISAKPASQALCQWKELIFIIMSFARFLTAPGTAFFRAWRRSFWPQLPHEAFPYWQVAGSSHVSCVMFEQTRPHHVWR